MGKFIVLAAAVLVVLAAWSGAWLYGAGQIRAAVESLAEGDGEGAPKVTCGRLGISGFPFRFDIECAEAAIVSGDRTTTLAGMKATLLAYNPTQARLSWLGPITYADAFSGSQSRIDFAAAQGSLRLKPRDLFEGLGGAGWRIERVSLVADDVTWTDTVLAERTALSAAHVEAHLVDLPARHDAAAGVAALAAYAELEDSTAPDLGLAGGDVSLKAEVSGVPDDLRAFGEEDAVRDWQAAGGAFKLVSLTGKAGEEYIQSSGTFALDAGGRLDGTAELKSKGLVERLGGMLPPEWRGLVLGTEAPDGSYSQKLTIKAGVVFSGLVPLFLIPPLI
jgi:hypothetical protein